MTTFDTPDALDATTKKALIDRMPADLEHIRSEVFRTGSMEDVMNRADRFFSMMPSLGVDVEEDDESGSVVLSSDD